MTDNRISASLASRRPVHRLAWEKALRTTTILTTLLLAAPTAPVLTSPAAAFGHCVEGVGPNGERQPCDDGGSRGSIRDYSRDDSSGSSGSSGSSSSAPRHPPAGSRPFLGWLLSPHVVADGNGHWVPEAGYRFVNSDADDLHVKWVSGLAHPEYSHVVSSATEGQWQPEDGYSWVSPGDNDDFEVVWFPGKAHPTMANIEAAPTQGLWRPRPGYAWVHADPPMLAASGGVRWNPGAAHPTKANVIAADAAGRWRPRLGYVWANANPRSLAESGGVKWNPEKVRADLEQEMDTLRDKLHGYAQRIRNLGLNVRPEDFEEWATLSTTAQMKYREQAAQALYDAGTAVLLAGVAQGIRQYYGSLSPPVANARITQLKSLGIDQWVPMGTSEAFFKILRDIAAHPGKPLESDKIKELINAASRVKASYDASSAAKDGQFAEALVQTLSIGVGDPKLAVLAAEFRFTIAALYRSATQNLSAYEVRRLTSIAEGDLANLKKLSAEMNAIGTKLHKDKNDLDKLDELGS